MEYEKACRAAEEYAKTNNILYDHVGVKEYQDKWLFNFAPAEYGYTTTPEIFIYKKTGIVERAHIPVPPLSNLEFYRKGKDIDFFEKE